MVSLAAACGYIRWRNNMKMLEGALDKLLVLLHRPVEDPLNLDAYQPTFKGSVCPYRFFVLRAPHTMSG